MGMDELKKALAEADDDYLIGISNKGIVKRAYKDSETANVNLGFVNQSAEVSVENVQCIIKVPLAESVCSCPSRTICRHIVTAILWLKKEWQEDTPTVPTAALPVSQPTTADAPAAAVTAPPTMPPTVSVSRAEKLAQELTVYPVEPLVKAMKKKYYNTFLEKAKVGVLPSMEESSTITVDILEDNTTVKLLSPLNYSACTCHSKELCKHKAAAILAWKLKHKVITLESLSPAEETTVMDIDRFKVCAGHCIHFLERILSDGLVRTPEDAAEYAEANALLCHQAGIPEGERLLREIGGRLKAYTAHSPEFRTDSLCSVMLEAYRLMTDIRQETDSEKLRQRIGVFKDSYRVTETLELIPLAQRSFSSAAGYEGEIYYFVNKNSGNGQPPFLTYSDVRPSFYENGRKSRKSEAPWGLYGLCDELMRFELRLLLPKLSGIRLSASSETKAMQLRRTDLNCPAVYEKIYTDFLRLIKDNFSQNSPAEDSETLVMLMPEKCIRSFFSETEQTHTIVVEDFYGQQLSLKARYHSKTRQYFEQLADVGETMLSHPDKSYVIFGNAYIENGACCIYPIAVFDSIHAPQPSHEARQARENGTSGYFANLFDDIRGLLCDITECGMYAFDGGTVLKDRAEECEQAGLSVLAGKLRDLSGQMAAQAHTFRDDPAAMLRLIGEIYAYTATGAAMVAVRCAAEKLYEREENDEFTE